LGELFRRHGSKWWENRTLLAVLKRRHYAIDLGSIREVDGNFRTAGKTETSSCPSMLRGAGYILSAFQPRSSSEYGITRHHTGAELGAFEVGAIFYIEVFDMIELPVVRASPHY
jgi:hypothetical protein